MYLPFYKITNNILRVDIKGSSGAQLVLADKPHCLNSHQEMFYINILIENTNVWISDNKNTKNDYISNEKDIISSTEFKTFFLTWIEKKISFGKPNQEPMLVYDLKLLNLNFVNFKCELNYIGFGSMAGDGGKAQEIYYKFEIPMRVPRKILPIKSGNLIWVKSTNGIPENAVIGGVEDGHPLYVIRAEVKAVYDLDEAVIPGKYSTLTGKASVPWYGLEDMDNSREIFKEEYEFLCGYNMKWVECQFHYVPVLKAFDAGELYVSGEYAPQSLYVIRARHEGNLIIGTVAEDADISAAWIPYKGKVVFVSQYEILCEKFDETEDEPIIVKRILDYRNVNRLIPELYEFYDSSSSSS